jgi:hypothetical protein
MTGGNGLNHEDTKNAKEREDFPISLLRTLPGALWAAFVVQLVSGR